MATTTTSLPDPQAPPPVSAMARITGVLFSPSKTFADIARRPSWVAPFLLLIALSLGISVLIGQKTDWRSFFERQMSSTGVPLICSKGRDCGSAKALQSRSMPSCRP